MPLTKDLSIKILNKKSTLSCNIKILYKFDDLVARGTHFHFGIHKTRFKYEIRIGSCCCCIFMHNCKFLLIFFFVIKLELKRSGEKSNRAYRVTMGSIAFVLWAIQFKKIIFLGCIWSTINSKCIIRRIGSFGIIWFQFQWPFEWMGWKTSMHHWRFGQRTCWRIRRFVDQDQNRFGSTYWWLAKMLIEWNHFRSDCVSLTGTK